MKKKFPNHQEFVILSRKCMTSRRLKVKRNIWSNLLGVECKVVNFRVEDIFLTILSPFIIK